MGMSASAEIVFGVDLGDRNPVWPWIDEDGYGYNEEGEEEELIELLPEYKELEQTLSPWLDERYLAYIQVCEQKPYHEQERFSVWKVRNPWFGKAFDIWHDKKEELEATIPVEVIRYGYHGGDGTYALALKDTNIANAYDYGSTKIDPDEFVAPFADDIAEAQAFCKKHNLPEFNDPGWLLLVSYG